MGEEYDRIRKEIAKKYCGGSSKIGVILADRILATEGIEIRDSNQDLPRDFCQDIIDEVGHTREDAGSYKRAQQDMLDAGFVKTKCRESNEGMPSK